MTVSAGAKKATRSLLFTVTRDGADWCIAGRGARRQHTGPRRRSDPPVTPNYRNPPLGAAASGPSPYAFSHAP